MGFLSKAKNAVTGGSGGGETSFEDEFDEDAMGGEPEIEEPDEPAEPEWDTAYQFADDAVQQMGFASLQEFASKAMIMRVEKSPLYRDRIESGVQTMGMITESMERVSDMRSRFDGDDQSDGYRQYVEEVKAANDLIDELDRMEGKEEQMAQEIIGTAQQAIQTYANKSGQSTGSVNANMGTRER